MFKLFGFNTTPIFNIAELFWGGFTGGNYQNPVLKYQTTAGLTAATAVADPVGLVVTNQPPGDGRGVVNLLLQTQVFDNASWTATSTVTANTTVAPDGTLTADTVDSTVADQILQQVVTVVNDTAVHSFSLFLKQGTAALSSLRLEYFGGTAVSFLATVNWGAGTITDNFGNATSVSLTPDSNGYYRATFSAANNGLGNTSLSARLLAAGSTFVGGATGTVIVWGAQLETNTTATTYQPNTVSLGGPGINPYQATAGSRPTVGRAPMSLPGGGGGVRTRANANSEDITVAGWQKIRSTATAANRLQEDATAANTHYTRLTLAVTTGVQWSWQVKLKQDQRYKARLTLGDGGGAFAAETYVAVDLGLGTIMATGAGADAATIDSAEDGYYLVTITATTINTTATGYFYVFMLDDAGSITYNGDGTSGLFVTQAMPEVSAAPTDYQKYTAAYDITETGVPSIAANYYDGGDYLTTGVQEITATADYLVEAGRAWSDAYSFATFTKGGTVGPAKASATAANRTLQTIIDGTSGKIRSYVRGGDTENNTADMTSGQWHSVIRVCDGTTFTIYVDGTAYTPTVGAAAEEAQNIIWNARTESSAGQQLTGFCNVDLELSRALSAGEVAQLYQQQKSYYGSP